MAHGCIEKESLREIVQGDKGSKVIHGKTTYQRHVISCHYNEVNIIACLLVSDHREVIICVCLFLEITY